MHGLGSDFYFSFGGGTVNELALFAGAGGGILGGKLLGWRTVCAVEFDPFARSILLARQRDGILERFPIWNDVVTFDGKPWAGRIDIITGGFPCQDISSAGSGKGISGARSGLWGSMARIIDEVRPRNALVENSPMLLVRGIGRVLGDLAGMGYHAAWGVLGGKHVGLPHHRERIWIAASNDNAQRGAGLSGRAAALRRNMDGHRPPESPVDRLVERMAAEGKQCQDGNEDCLPSYLCRTTDGVARNVDRLERIGNGQIPAVAALAWRLLSR